MKRVKFTTTLSLDSLAKLKKLSHLIEVRNLNEVIEYLIEKEIQSYEMDI